MLNLKFRILGESRTNLATRTTLGELNKVEGALARVSDKAVRAGRKMRNIGAGLTAGLTAPLTLLGGNALRLYDQQVKAETAVATAIKSTGGAAGFTLKELKALASARQRLTVFGDEDILQNVTTPLLTFTQIGKDMKIFERAQTSVLDMSTALQIDLKSAALQVGKALNDPVRGVTALSRAGVQFTDKQRDVIKSLVATGDVAGAQLIILKELETQFAGQAAAAANSPLGKIKQLSNAWGDLKEQLGGEIAPVLTPLVNSVQDAVAWFSKLSPSVKKGIVVVGGLTAAIGPLVAGVGLLTIGLGGLAAVSAPVWITISAVTALAAGAVALIAKWDKVKGWFVDLWDGIKRDVTDRWMAIRRTLERFSPREMLFRAWSGVTGWFADLWSDVRGHFARGWQNVRRALSDATPRWLKRAWSGFSRWFSGVWSDVARGVADGWSQIRSTLASFVPDWLKSLWTGLPGWFADVWSRIRSGVSAGWSAIKDALRAHSPQFVKDLWSGLAGWFGRQWAAVQAGVTIAWDLIKGLFTGTYSASEVVHRVWTGLQGWFTDQWAGVKQAFVDAWALIKEEVGQWPGRMQAIGRDMMLGLAKGMEVNLNSPVGTVGEIMLKLIGKAQDVTRTRSPSRVFMDLGRNIMDGLRLGIAGGKAGVMSEMEQVGQTLAKPVQNSPVTDLLMGLIKRTTTFGEYFRREMARAGDALLRFALNKAWGRLFQNMGALQGGGQFGGGLGGLVASAIGGLLSPSPRVARPQPRPFAKGGIVVRPTHFPMAGSRSGVMGERGPEGILPLSRIGGELGVRATLPSGGGDTHINLSVDARGAQDPAAVEMAVDRALARAMPELVATSGRIARQVVDDRRRRGAI